MLVCRYRRRLCIRLEKRSVLPTNAFVIYQQYDLITYLQDEGKGTNGLQFIELRNYYDYSLIQKAKASIIK